jgi:hypothetical protein
VLSRRPTVCKMKNQKLLHVKYQDGFEVKPKT